MLHKKLAETQGIPNMIGEHPKMKEVVRMINKIAPTNSDRPHLWRVGHRQGDGRPRHP